MLARVNDGFNKNFAPTLFDFFSRPLADFDNMFTPMATDNARVDIKDLGDRYQLKADMPGVKKEDMEIAMNMMPKNNQAMILLLNRYLK